MKVRTNYGGVGSATLKDDHCCSNLTQKYSTECQTLSFTCKCSKPQLKCFIKHGSCQSISSSFDRIHMWGFFSGNICILFVA